MMKKLLFTCMLLVAGWSYGQAQSWQWGKGGGSADAGSGGPDETVIDMAIDPHGNIYVLSTVWQTALRVDGHSLTGYGYEDVLISSFKCDGTYRWSKNIGSNSQDIGRAIKTDTLGGVYVSGLLACDYLTDHIDIDSTWSGRSYKFIFLLKYDTAGNYKWLRMPEPDSITVFGTGSNTYDLDVDGGGNSFMLCKLNPGAFGNGGYVVSSPGQYILKYDKNGNFSGGHPMQITGDVGGTLKRDQQLGRYYITGALSGLPYFNTTPITSSQFIGCFDNSGNLMWVKQGTDYPSDYSNFARVSIDPMHNLYLTSRGSGSDTFGTFIQTNAGSASPIVYKLDTNGNVIWAKNATVNGVTNSSTIITDGREVIVAGCNPGLLKWPSYADSLNQDFGGGYSIYATRFNAITGQVLGIDSLKSDFGVNNNSTALAMDKFGNYYLGGNFASYLYVPVPGDTLANIGGGSDFFVAKFGRTNCTVPISLEVEPVQVSNLNDIRVFPNPSKDELNITEVGKNVDYALYNITGKCMMQGHLNEGRNTLDMLHLVAGIYILEMKSSDGERKVVRVAKD